MDANNKQKIIIILTKTGTAIKTGWLWLTSKLTFRDWIIILLSILCIGFYLSYRHYYTKSLTPIVVYNTDSLEVYKNKVKELYVSKDVYVLNIDDLKKQNTELALEVKNLKDNPIVVTKSDISVLIDTVYAKSDTIILTNDSIYNLQWHVEEPKGYYTLSGVTDVHSDFSSFMTTINTFKLNTKLTFDILDNGDNKFRLIGKTDNPYINITNMEGAVFDPTTSTVFKKYYKQKKWSIGPMVGYGLTSDLKLRPYIGIGISYGIILF